MGTAINSTFTHTAEVPATSGLLTVIFTFPYIILESHVHCSLTTSGNIVVYLEVYMIVIYITYGAYEVAIMGITNVAIFPNWSLWLDRHFEFFWTGYHQYFRPRQKSKIFYLEIFINDGSIAV
jgi:hypothetical protein